MKLLGFFDIPEVDDDDDDDGDDDDDDGDGDGDDDDDDDDDDVDDDDIKDDVGIDCWCDDRYIIFGLHKTTAFVVANIRSGDADSGGNGSDDYDDDDGGLTVRLWYHLMNTSLMALDTIEVISDSHVLSRFNVRRMVEWAGGLVNG